MQSIFCSIQYVLTKRYLKYISLLSISVIASISLKSMNECASKAELLLEFTENTRTILKA